MKDAERDWCCLSEALHSCIRVGCNWLIVLLVLALWRSQTASIYHCKLWQTIACVFARLWPFLTNPQFWHLPEPSFHCWKDGALALRGLNPFLSDIVIYNQDI